MLLKDATKVYVGGTPATKVYLGSQLVWGSEPGGFPEPQVLFSANGATNTASIPITIPAGVAASTTLFLYRGAVGTLTSNDPNAIKIADATLPNVGRMTVWNCDDAGKSFTITSTATTWSWLVVGMDAPRVGAAALGQNVNTTSVVPGLTLDAPVLGGDRAIGIYAANNSVTAWTTPELETVLFSQVGLGTRVHIVGGLTFSRPAAGSMILGDADRGDVLSRIEHSAVALFRLGESMYSSSAPTGANTDNSHMSLGSQFTVLVAGRITGLRFYNNVATSRHTALWTDAGVKLAEGYSAATVGWQVVPITPVAVTANQVLRVGYAHLGGAYVLAADPADTAHLRYETGCYGGYGADSTAFPSDTYPEPYAADVIYQEGPL
jgi:hypothetical protein